MTNCCMNCDYCDKRRKNAIGMPRCKQHNMFVAPDDCCDFHCNKGVIEKELWTKMKGAVDEDNQTQNQRGNPELNTELKPCPFCGGEARITVIQKGYKSIIECTTHYCGFARHSFNNGETDEQVALRLTTAWNRRATDERAD